MKKNAKIPLRMTRKLQKDLGIDFSMSLVETLADLKIILDDNIPREYTLFSGSSLHQGRVLGASQEDEYWLEN